MERQSLFVPIAPEITGEIIEGLRQDHTKIATEAFRVAQRVFDDVNFTFRLIGKDENDEPDTLVIMGGIFTLLAGEMTGRRRFDVEVPGQILLGSLVSFGIKPLNNPDEERVIHYEYLEKVKSDPYLMQIMQEIKERDQLEDVTFEGKVLKGAAHIYRYLEEEGVSLNNLLPPPRVKYMQT